MATLKVPVNANDHIQGAENAPITLVEYGDYECEFCGMAYPIVKRLQKHFGAKLRFVFRNFPLNEVHPHAELAAETAEFASAQGRFWEMHDLLYENQDHFSPKLMLQLAEKLQLSTEDLQAALENRTYLARIKSDFMGGVQSGVNGTPTFYINDIRHDDVYEYPVLVAAIEAKL